MPKHIARRKNKKTASAKNDLNLCIVGGAGRVGLPLGVAFALAGVKTTLFDINEIALKQIASGTFPFKEDHGDYNLKRAIAMNTLSVSTDPSAISRARIVMMVIGTPIDEYLNPNFHDVHNFIKKNLSYFKDGQVLIMRSTIYPGTSERVQGYFEESGKEVRVAFCPERIVEGHAFEEIKNFPQIVSAFDNATLEVVKELFQKITKKKMVPLMPIEAELVKLFSNAWRYLQFAVANQFFMIATDHNLDYHKIYRAMTDGYDRCKDIPRPGFSAGPCLLKDTMQLSAFHRNNFFIGHAAMLINEGLPSYIIKKLEAGVPDIKSKTIGILGMTFKAESDDIRDSLSFKLRKVAGTVARKVLCHDFYVNSEQFFPLKTVLEKSDIIILAAPHRGYKKIRPQKYPKKVFIDIWNFWTTP
ncbi:nucleotide sugar dehydrogenase [Candidatus Parcubacteria bacterium]|nr:MAG: nucleotide sugar dehydrogenase [Candidatus Parcubacteria bacterium]